MERHHDDPLTFTVEPVTLDEPLHRGGLRRIPQERRYGSLLASRIAAFQPDAVMSANTPLDAEAAAHAQARQSGAAAIFWVQDLYSIAISRILGRRLRLVGQLVGARFVWLERRLLRGSDAVVAISPAFLPVMARWGVSRDRISVIENWAPVDDAILPDSSNSWSREQGLTDRRVLLYSGTLALKHDPGVLLTLAKQVPEADVVVVSEGPGSDWLRMNGAEVKNLHVLPYQPFSRLPEVLASADVLLAVLEPDASSFSVPSKVSTYLAAGRPILAAMPDDNPAAQVITRVGAGRVVAPGDPEEFVTAGRELLANRATRRAAGAAGREYAMAAFAIGPITDRFEAILRRSVAAVSADPSRFGASLSQEAPATEGRQAP
jgi:colanic acid biosynthesis glycosyl transferase WcaI